MQFTTQINTLNEQIHELNQHNNQLNEQIKELSRSKGGLIKRINQLQNNYQNKTDQFNEVISQLESEHNHTGEIQTQLTSYLIPKNLVSETYDTLSREHIRFYKSLKHGFVYIYIKIISNLFNIYNCV